MLPSKRWDATVISSIASSKAASWRLDGFVNPLTLRTNWRAASRISASVATMSAWRRVLMLRHMAHNDREELRFPMRRQLRQLRRRQTRRVKPGAFDHCIGQTLVPMLRQVADRIRAGAHQLTKAQARDRAVCEHGAGRIGAAGYRCDAHKRQRRAGLPHVAPPPSAVRQENEEDRRKRDEQRQDDRDAKDRFVDVLT